MTTQTIPARIVFRRDTAAAWTTANPVLLNGELGLETDTRKLKIGDGASTWGSLAYYSTSGGGGGGNTILSGSGAPSSGGGVNGDLYLDSAASRLYGPKAAGSWGAGVSLIGPAGSAGATGATGATGAAGASATVAVGSVTTGAAGSSASVSNAGTSSAAVLNFTIPRGDTGATGTTGAAGSAATVSVGSVTTGAAGSSASVTNTGTSSAAVFAFTIPRGDTGATGSAGATGPQGPAGAAGSAATISVGSVTTGAAGSSASVTNSGTSSAAVLNFTIPRGDTGTGGSGSGTVTSVGLSLPGLFSVSGSPVTSSGTLSATLATQSANLVWAGPTTGVAAAPTFRALVAGDIPTIASSQVSGLATSATTDTTNASNIGTGTLAAARLPSTAALTTGSTITQQYAARQSVAISGTTYALDVTSGNEFVTAAAIAGNVTINLSGLSSIPANSLWRGVLRFAYTSGTISWFTGNSGYTVKWDGGTAITPTASETECVVIEVYGTTIEIAALRGRT
jgi:hypothetical protein